MTVKVIVQDLLKGRFSLLLLTLGLLFFVGPLIPGNQSLVDQVLAVLNLTVLVGCLRAIARTRKFFVFMLAYTILMLAFGGFELLQSSEGLRIQRMIILGQVSYYLIMFVSVMRYVLGAGAVTADKIFGAICAYLILGLVWAWAYILFYHLDAGCFKIPADLLSNEALMSSWAVYFSFTTMTALGYGDITPLTPAVQSYAIMQAATGQLFVVVILGRLIALQIAHSGDDAIGESNQ